MEYRGRMRLLARMVKIERWSTEEVARYMNTSILTVTRAVAIANHNKWDLNDVPITN